jgi:hypothetical protein
MNVSKSLSTVSHGELRSILICLLEVGRLSVKYGIEPPALVTLEHQIDKESADSQRATTTDEESQDEHNKENPKAKPISGSVKSANIGKVCNLSDSTDSGLPGDEEPQNNGAGDSNQSGIMMGKTQLDLKV